MLDDSIQHSLGGSSLLREKNVKRADWAPE